MTIALSEPPEAEGSAAPSRSDEIDVTDGAEAASRGPLGLRGDHLEIADLIRRAERLGCGAEEAVVRDAARRVVERLARHVDDERDALERVDSRRRQRLEDGQRALLTRAAAYATAPTADAGADLLALLVRQADAESDAFETAPPPARRADRLSEFTTDWALPPAAAVVGVGSLA